MLQAILIFLVILLITAIVVTIVGSIIAFIVSTIWELLTNPLGCLITLVIMIGVVLLIMDTI